MLLDGSSDRVDARLSDDVVVQVDPAVGVSSSFLGGRGEVDPAHADDLSVPLTFRLLLDLVGDRERNLVLLDAGVENLVVEERGGLRFEEDAGSLLIDHLVILSG